MRYVPGFRTYLPPQIQWQPTLTAHDPNPPITINEAAGGAVSASAAQTLDGVGQSATATLAIQASAAQTLATVTQSAAATLAISASAAQTLDDVSQSAAATISQPASATPSGGKGGWDPHAYKRRPKRKKVIEAFLDKIEAAPLSEAPEDVQAKAEAARIAAEKFLADQTDALRTRALAKIEAFYEEIRSEIARRDEEDDEDWLLLAA